MATTVGHLQVKIDADGSGVARGVSQAESSLKGLEHSAGRVGSVMQGVFMGAGIAMFGGIVSGVQGAISATTNYEKTLSGISAVMDRTKSDFTADMAIVRATTLQLGADTAFSSSQAAQGFEEMIKAGIDVKEVYGGGVQAALNLAAAGGIGVARAAEISSGAMNTWGIKGTEAAHVADLLAGAANASQLSVDDLGLAIGQGGAVAAKMGMPIEDFTAVVAQMGREGTKGATAGTNLRNMLVQMASPTDKARTLAQGLGLSWKDSSGNLKDAASMAQMFQDKLGGFDRLKQIDILSTLFGQEGAQAAISMMGAGKAGIEGMHEAIKAVGAEEVAKERLNNLAGDMDALSGSAETLAIKFGQALDPALRAGTQMMTGFLNSLGSNPAVIGFVEGLGNSLVTFGGQVQSLFGVLGSTGGDRAGFLQALGLDESTATTVGSILDTIQGKVTNFFSVITSTGGDRAGFLGKLGFSKTDAENIGRLLDDIQGKVQKFFDNFPKTDIAGVFNNVAGALQKIVTADRVSAVLEGVNKALSALPGLGKSAADALGAVATKSGEVARAWQGLGPQGQAAFAGFATAALGAQLALQTLIPVMAAARAAALLMWASFSLPATLIVGGFALVAAAWNADFLSIQSGVSRFGEALRVILTTVVGTIGGMLSGVGRMFQVAGTEIGAFVDAMVNMDWSKADQIAAGFMDKVKAGFADGFTDLRDKTVASIDGFFGQVGGGLSKTGEAIGGAVKSVMDTATTTFTESAHHMGQTNSAMLQDLDSGWAAASTSVGASIATTAAQYADLDRETTGALTSMVDTTSAQFAALDRETTASLSSLATEGAAAVAGLNTDATASIDALASNVVDKTAQIAEVTATALTTNQAGIASWASETEAVVAAGTQSWTDLAGQWPDQSWATASAGLATYQAGLNAVLEQNGAAITAATPFWEQALSDWVSTAQGRAEGYFATYFGMVVSTLNNLTTAMQATASGQWVAALSDWVPVATAQVTSGLSAMVSSMLGILAGAAGSLRAAGTTMGSAVVDGFMAGFESRKGAAEAAVSAWAGRVSAAARAELAVQSPSKVFADIGSETVQGFIVGIGDMEPAAISAIEGLADTTMGAGKRRFGGLALDTGEVIGRGFNQSLLAGIPSSVAAVEQWSTILLDRIERGIYDLGSHFRLDEVGDGWNRAGALLMESFSAGFGGNVGRLTEEASNVLNMLRHMIAERTEEFEDVGDLVALSFQAGVAGRQGDWLATVRVGLSALEEEAARRADNFEDVGDLIGMAFGLGFGDSHTEMTQVFAGQLDDLEREVYERRENFQSAGDVLAKAMQLGLDAAGADIGQTFMQNIAEGITAAAGYVQSALFDIGGRVGEFLSGQGVEWLGGGDWRADIRAQAGLLEHEGSAVMADAMNNIAGHAGDVYSEGAQESLDKATADISRTFQRGQLQIADDLDNSLAKALNDLQKNIAEAGEKAGEGAAKAVAAAHRKFNEAVEKGATGAALAKLQLTLDQDLREAAEKSGEAGEKGVRDAQKKYDEARAAAYGQSDNKFRQLQQQAVLRRESAIESAEAATAAAAIAANKKATEKIAEEAKKQAEKLATAQSHLAMTPEIIAAGYAAYEAEVIKEGRVVNTAVLATLTADFLGKAETELAQVGESAAETQMRAYKERGIKDATAAAEAIEKAQVEAKKKATAKADKDAALSLDQFRSTQTYGFNAAQAQAGVEASRPQWELVGRKVSEFVAVGAAAGGEDIARRTMVAVTNPHAIEVHKPALAAVGRKVVEFVAEGAGANGEDIVRRIMVAVVNPKAIQPSQPALAAVGRQIVTYIAEGAGANGEDIAKRAMETVVKTINQEVTALPAKLKAGGIAKAGQEMGETFGLSAGKSAATTMLGTMANEIYNPANRRKLGGAMDDLGADLSGRLHKGMVHGTGTGKDKVWDPIYGAYFGDPEWKAIVAQGILDGQKAFDAAQERIWFGDRQGKMGGVQGLDGPGFDAGKEWSTGMIHGIQTSASQLGLEVDKALAKPDAKKAGKEAGEDYASELTGAVRQIMGQFNPFSGARNLADLWAGYVGMGMLATGADGQKSFAEQVADYRKKYGYDDEQFGIGRFEMPGRGGTADDLFKSTFNYDRETKSYPGPGNSSLPSNYGGINNRNAGEPGNINHITIELDGKVLAEVLLDRMGGKMGGMY